MQESLKTFYYRFDMHKQINSERNYNPAAVDGHDLSKPDCLTVGQSIGRWSMNKADVSVQQCGRGSGGTQNYSIRCVRLCVITDNCASNATCNMHVL